MAACEEQETSEDLVPEDLIWQAPVRWRKKFGAWEKQELLTVDASISRVVQLYSDEPVITPYRPMALWLMKQWRGTVLPPVAFLITAACLVATAFSFSVRLGLFGAATWPLFSMPDVSHPLIQKLLPLNALWQQSSAITTFILTFFLGQAYNYWRKSYQLCRSLQGRLYDINLMLATHCFRDGSGQYTADARALLQDVARYTRLLHILFWAGIDDSLVPIRTDEGFKRLVQRGVMTERECFALTSAGATWSPRATYHLVIIGWIMSRTIDARVRETLEWGAGTESVFVNNILQLRARATSIRDEMAARMPMAYVHLVHLLVDTLLILAPFALCARYAPPTHPSTLTTHLSLPWAAIHLAGSRPVHTYTRARARARTRTHAHTHALTVPSRCRSRAPG